MRWIDKPRKFNAEIIVIQYFKFLKMMGIFNKTLTTYYNAPSSYFDAWTEKRNLSFIYSNSSKKLMIIFFTNRLKYYKNLTKYVLYDVFWNGNVLAKEDKTKLELFWEYLKEKHMQNCIICDSYYFKQ